MTTPSRRLNALCYADPQQWFEAIIPEDKAKVKDIFKKLRDNKVKDVSVEFRIIRADGALRTLFCRAFPVKDKRGKIISLLGITTDLTEYQQMKDLLILQRDIVNILKKSKTLEKISSKLLRIICNSLNWNMGVIWLIDPIEKVLRCIDLWDKENLKMKSLVKVTFDISFKKGISLPGRVWKKKKSIWVPHLYLEEHLVRAKYMKDVGLKSFFGFQLVYRNKMYGVIEFFSENVEKPNPDLLNILETIAIQLGEFIHHKHAEDELILMTHQDLLTGLMNYSIFEEKLTKKI